MTLMHFNGKNLLDQIITICIYNRQLQSHMESKSPKGSDGEQYLDQTFFTLIYKLLIQ